MASVTLTRPDVFPNGTTVGAYAAEAIPADAIGQAPRGAAISSGTVTSDGVTLPGLEYGIRYYAVGQVGGVWRWVGFEPQTAPATPSIKGFAQHGTDAGMARPDYVSVEWAGSVEPLNALDGDTWVVG